MGLRIIKELQAVLKNKESLDGVDEEVYELLLSSFEEKATNIRKERLKEDKGFIEVGKLTYEDLLINAMATYNNKKDLLQSINETREFVEYEIRKLERKLHLKRPNLKSDCLMLANLSIINVALNTKDEGLKLQYLTKASEYARHSFKSYAMHLPSGDMRNRSNTKAIIEDLEKFI